jgi:hypothetical protein
MLNSAEFANNLIASVKSLSDGWNYRFFSNSFPYIYTNYAIMGTATGQQCTSGDAYTMGSMLAPYENGTIGGNSIVPFIDALFNTIQVYWRTVIFTSAGYCMFNGDFANQIGISKANCKQYFQTAHTSDDAMRYIANEVHNCTRKVYVVFTLPNPTPLPPNYVL